MIEKSKATLVSTRRLVLEKFWKPSFFFRNIIMPLMTLAVYFGSFAWLISSIFSYPTGVNYFYASRSWQYILGLAITLLLLYIVSFKLIKKSNWELKLTNLAEKTSGDDYLLLLFAITPAIQYIISNQEILSILDVLIILGIFIASSALYIIIIPAFMGYLGSPRIIRILGLAFVYTIINMASISKTFAWFEEGSLRIQWLLFAGVFLFVGMLYRHKNKKYLRLFILISFAANTSTQLFAESEKINELSEPSERLSIASLIDGPPDKTPSIYLLIYDSYVPNETMLSYGIDNSPQEEYLEDLGFVLYPHTYSIAGETLDTMSPVLNASVFSGGYIRKSLSGDGEVQIALKTIGYETHGIFTTGYFFRGTKSKYDYTFPNAIPISASILLEGILIGEFRFDLDFTLDYDTPSHLEFVEAKRSFLESVNGETVFLYTHSNRPAHSQNSGVCRPNETDLWFVRLEEANHEMKEDIELIIDNDPEAIIIVAGDHGPYLTKNCTITSGAYDISEITRLDIQDRNGSFLAIRWPTAAHEDYDDIIVLQDLFPAIFAYLYQDKDFLDYKVPPISYPSFSGVEVDNGIILDGVNAGEPLYIFEE